MIILKVKKKEIITDILKYDSDNKEFQWIKLNSHGKIKYTICIPEWIGMRITEFYNNTKDFREGEGKE